MDNLMMLQRQIDPPRLFLDGHELFGIVSYGFEYLSRQGDYIVARLSLCLEVIPYEMNLDQRSRLRGRWMTFKTVQYEPGHTGVFLDHIELREVIKCNLEISPTQFLPHLDVEMYVKLDPEDPK